MPGANGPSLGKDSLMITRFCPCYPLSFALTHTKRANWTACYLCTVRTEGNVATRVHNVHENVNLPSIREHACVSVFMIRPSC